jgi:hypothetical protein
MIICSGLSGQSTTTTLTFRSSGGTGLPTVKQRPSSKRPPRKTGHSMLFCGLTKLMMHCVSWAATGPKSLKPDDRGLQCCSSVGERSPLRRLSYSRIFRPRIAMPENRIGVSKPIAPGLKCHPRVSDRPGLRDRHRSISSIGPCCRSRREAPPLQGCSSL